MSVIKKVVLAGVRISERHFRIGNLLTKSTF
jgi:hypothetical protein